MKIAKVDYSPIMRAKAMTHELERIDEQQKSLISEGIFGIAELGIRFAELFQKRREEKDFEEARLGKIKLKREINDAMYDLLANNEIGDIVEHDARGKLGVSPKAREVFDKITDRYREEYTGKDGILRTQKAKNDLLEYIETAIHSQTNQMILQGYDKIQADTLEKWSLGLTETLKDDIANGTKNYGRYIGDAYIQGLISKDRATILLKESEKYVQVKTLEKNVEALAWEGRVPELTKLIQEATFLEPKEKTGLMAYAETITKGLDGGANEWFNLEYEVPRAQGEPTNYLDARAAIDSREMSPTQRAFLHSKIDGWETGEITDSLTKELETMKKDRNVAGLEDMLERVETDPAYERMKGALIPKINAAILATERDIIDQDFQRDFTAKGTYENVAALWRLRDRVQDDPVYEGVNEDLRRTHMEDIRAQINYLEAKKPGGLDPKAANDQAYIFLREYIDGHKNFAIFADTMNSALFGVEGELPPIIDVAAHEKYLKKGMDHFNSYITEVMDQKDQMLKEAKITLDATEKARLVRQISEVLKRNPEATPEVIEEYVSNAYKLALAEKWGGGRDSLGKVKLEALKTETQFDETKKDSEYAKGKYYIQTGDFADGVMFYDGVREFISPELKEYIESINSRDLNKFEKWLKDNNKDVKGIALEHDPQAVTSGDVRFRVKEWVKDSSGVERETNVYYQYMYNPEKKRTELMRNENGRITFYDDSAPIKTPTPTPPSNLKEPYAGYWGPIPQPPAESAVTPGRPSIEQMRLDALSAPSGTEESWKKLGEDIREGAAGLGAAVKSGANTIWTGAKDLFKRARGK